MSHTQLSPPSTSGTPEIDNNLIELLGNIRNAVLHLLRPEQANPRPTGADLSAGLAILKSATDTSWRIAVRAGMESERERLFAETKKIQAETEKLVAEKEKLWAEKDKMLVEADKIATKEKAKVQEENQEWKVESGEEERSKVKKDCKEQVEVRDVDQLREEKGRFGSQKEYSSPAEATAALEHERIVAEQARTRTGTEKILAEAERYTAEKDKIKVDAERLTAEKEKIQAETERLTANKMKLLADTEWLKVETKRVREKIN